MARTKGESEKKRKGKRHGRLVGAAKTSKELAKWCRLQWKNLSILGLPKKRVVSIPQREQLASTPVLLLPTGKGTKPSVKVTRPCDKTESRRKRGGTKREHEE